MWLDNATYRTAQTLSPFHFMAGSSSSREVAPMESGLRPGDCFSDPEPLPLVLPSQHQ